MRVLLAAGLLLVGACTKTEPLEGIDLPPASIPDNIDPANWAVAFSHDFGPGFWEEGPHAYQLFLDCDHVGEAQTESEVILFAAAPDVPSFDDPVRLRIGGLSTTAMGSADVRLVSTGQHTIALVTVVGLGEDEAEAASQCTGEVYWDAGESALLQPGDPFRP